MKITFDTTDIVDGLETNVITPLGMGDTISGKAFFSIKLIQLVGSFILLSLAMVPALVYVYLVMENWEVLKAEGLTLWQAGTGLVAAYGLALHWWRTSIQDKLYKVEMKKSYRQDLRDQST